MSLNLVCFGRREDANPADKLVQTDSWGTCTIFDNYFEEDARQGAYAEFDGAIFSRYTVTAEMMADLTNSRAITRFGAGVNAIDDAAASDMGKIVVSTHTYGPETIAEHADRLLLSVRGRGPSMHDMVRLKIWNDLKSFMPDFPDRPTIDCTLGIVGVGEIGRSSVYRQLGKWRNIIAYDPYPDPSFPLAQDGSLQFVTLPELLTQSDAVIVHCAQTPSSTGMFDRNAFQQMKPGAYFINVARGGVMVDDDLVAALESGHLGGAGIDVFVDEPPSPSSPLLAYANSENGQNLVLSPHIAGLITQTARTNIIQHSYESLIRAVRLQYDNSLPWNEWPRSIINFQVVKSYPAYEEWKQNAVPSVRWRLIEAGELDNT